MFHSKCYPLWESDLTQILLQSIQCHLIDIREVEGVLRSHHSCVLGIVLNTSDQLMVFHLIKHSSESPALTKDNKLGSKEQKSLRSCD